MTKIKKIGEYENGKKINFKNNQNKKIGEYENGKKIN